MAFRRRKIIAIACILIIGSCDTFNKVSYNYDRSIDFRSYRTFAWTPEDVDDPEKVKTEDYDMDIVRNNAKNYITHAFSQRGFTVDVDSPDMVLQLVLLNEEKERIVTRYADFYPGYYFYNPYYFPYYYPRYRFYTWYGWGYPPHWSIPISQHTETYLEGTITLNVFDRKLKKRIWTASTEGDIYDSKYLLYPVHPAIDLLLNKFPVKPLKGKSSDLNINNRIPRSNGIEYNQRE
ncbi:DUF4136 domain-containing protein [Cyclobacterium jeungdonense]|uniref:DUF4136 domain-containing protein n=1 Tax=Cyclobacterium jeungdonense TaxID=708087 RepID=A0ABT8CBH1_9BACT|nr:DUF4136 domain-containing protein [Cyclobacterium jeungdonense]MDN3690158.1 DUF4136 domain-containing protein [Cyclobacterium jeungdonense]